MRLEIGARGNLTVRHRHLAAPSAASILYASDLHLSGRTPHIVQQVKHVVERSRPDVVLFGGDMVDSINGFEELTSLIQHICSICPVWAVSGNHERYVGVEKVRACVEAAGAGWLDNTAFYLTSTIRITGTGCPISADHNTFSILCAHEPDVFPTAANEGYQLVLAGHLHGSQFVLFPYHAKLYPGAWFFRWNGDVFTQNNCTMLVSRGVNDTLPIRWNCPREVILCSIG